MKYKALRSFIRSKNIDKPYTLSRYSSIIYDSKSFFNVETYKKSECQYIYGAECDRYANYLKMKFNWLTKCGVTCYVVFNGGMKADLETRKEIHENLIQNRCHIDPGNAKDNFFDPIFAKNVHLEILDELGIRYFFSMYDSREAIISLAKKLCAPVVTNFIEYCFYGVSCIPPNSITFESERKIATCKIYLDKVFASILGVQLSHTPLLLSLLDEDSDYFEYLPGVILDRYTRVVNALVYWIRRTNNKNDAKSYVLTCLRSDSDKKMFLDLYKEHEIILEARNLDVVRHFQSKKPNNFIMKHDWFLSGVSNSNIAVPYINLTKMGILSGCWLIPDVQKDDALLAAVDIIGFVHCLLTSSRNSILTFIGRKGNECHIWDIERKWDTTIRSHSIFKRVQTTRNKVSEPYFDISNPFRLFLDESLKGFDYDALMSLRQDSWILIITLVYYIKKRNKNFVKASYCVILSYVMLGYVTAAVGIIKRSNFTVSHNVCESVGNNSGLIYEDCRVAADTFMDLFYIQDLKSKFDSSILHDFAEFQHCLQHMNFLNKLCRETVKCTIYNKTFNGTFVYNVYCIIKDKENPLEHLKNMLGQSSVTLLYIDILDAFDKCLTSVGIESIMTDLLSSYHVKIKTLNLNCSETTGE